MKVKGEEREPMTRTSAVIRVVILACAVGSWTAAVLHAQQAPAAAQPAAPVEPEFPEAPGSDTFINACSQCHDAALATVVRQSRDDWKKVVASMEDRGAVFAKEDVTIIVDYLTEHFGTELNVNKARAKEIAGFLNVSQEQATALVRVRDTSGPFKNWDDLAKVPGLDIKAIEGKKNLIKF